MPGNLFTNTPAREAGYQMVQYIAARANPTGAISAYYVKVGALPAGSIITMVSTNVETAITGSTPVFNVGTSTTGAQIAATIALTAGSLNTVPIAALVMPLAADTDVYANISGTATGDAYVVVQFVKPLS